MNLIRIHQSIETYLNKSYQTLNYVDLQNDYLD